MMAHRGRQGSAPDIHGAFESSLKSDGFVVTLGPVGAMGSDPAPRPDIASPRTVLSPRIRSTHLSGLPKSPKTVALGSPVVSAAAAHSHLPLRVDVSAVTIGSPPLGSTRHSSRVPTPSARYSEEDFTSQDPRKRHKSSEYPAGTPHSNGSDVSASPRISPPSAPLPFSSPRARPRPVSLEVLPSPLSSPSNPLVRRPSMSRSNSKDGSFLSPRAPPQASPRAGKRTSRGSEDSFVPSFTMPASMQLQTY